VFIFDIVEVLLCVFDDSFFFEDPKNILIKISTRYAYRKRVQTQRKQITESSCAESYADFWI
jgi:hypothetical protein